MLHLVSDQAHTFLTTYFLIGIGLTGVTVFSGILKKSYEGPLKQAWDVVTHLKGEKQNLVTQVSQLRREYRYQAEQLETYKQQAQAYESQLASLQSRYSHLSEEYESLQASYQSLEEARDEELRQRQRELNHAQAEIAELHSLLERANYDNEQLREHYQAQEQALVEQTSAHSQLQESYRLLESEQITLNTQWQTTKTEYVNLLESYQELQNTLEELQQQHQLTQVELTALESEVGEAIGNSKSLREENDWLEYRLQKLRFWEWLMGGCNNFVPRSKSLLTFYVGVPLQAWWQSVINPASSQT